MADPTTGEIVAEVGEVLTRERAQMLDALGVNEAVVEVEDLHTGVHLVKVFSNNMVDMKGFVDFDPEEAGVTEKVRFTVLRELLEQRGQQLVSALTPGITVPADASLLGKAVGNLLSNASRYSPEGAEIRVWCGRLEGRPALSVENTGARISGDALPHLFEAFYREEGSRNRSTGGSGLGLYLVKMILDRHGAVCTIENTEEGVKATVRF